MLTYDKILPGNPKLRFEDEDYFKALGRAVLQEHPEFQLWLEYELGLWAAPEHVCRGPEDFCDYLARPEPDCVAAQAEFDFRRGFRYGIIEACYAIHDLKSKGFIRPTEIGNIIFEFCETDVLKWLRSWKQDFKKHISPSFKHDSWWDIRKRIIERDGGRCVTLGCLSTDDLHVDHIVPVCEGGLPTDDNLQCLCKKCNYAKGSK